MYAYKICIVYHCKCHTALLFYEDNCGPNDYTLEVNKLPVSVPASAANFQITTLTTPAHTTNCSLV